MSVSSDRCEPLYLHPQVWKSGTDLNAHLHDFFSWFLLLLNVNIKLDSLWNLSVSEVTFAFTPNKRTLQPHSHRSKVKVKICFDTFPFFFVIFRFHLIFRSMWTRPKTLYLLLGLNFRTSHIFTRVCIYINSSEILIMGLEILINGVLTSLFSDASLE